MHVSTASSCFSPTAVAESHCVVTAKKIRLWLESYLFCSQHKTAAARAAAALPERSADRQLALSDISEPELVDHGVSVVIGEGSAVGQEGRGEQAVAH